ncbi:MAG TPA: hypothetical protein VGO91_19455 [Pyrinomonadaceae bacterium]|nr:hypothetical protein [Pyrinomonadaceae bacterium]
MMRAVESGLKNNASGAGFSLAWAVGSVGRGLKSVFGCWHTEMGRPQTQGEETYRACLGCGARRRFDPESWQMSGEFYFHQPATGELYAREASAARPLKRRPALLKVAA